MNDPYETLGVPRSATDKEIKEAFKKLARKFHPDLHPGDKAAETKFKEISAANDLLKDKEKRRRSMRARLTLPVQSSQNSSSIVTSPMDLPMPRTPPKTDLRATKN